MRSKDRRIIVIATLIQRKAHYVKTAVRRQDGRHTVELTISLAEAKEFDTRKEAETVKDKIHNPYERIYAVEETIVDWPKRAVTSLPGNFS